MAGILITNSNSGAPSELSEHISRLPKLPNYEDETAFAFRGTMDPHDPSIVDIPSGNDSMPLKAQLEESDYSSYESSSSADFDYHGNSLLFPPLPTLSVAHTQPRQRLFATRLARLQQNVASSGGITRSQPSQMGTLPQSSHSSKSPPTSYTETHLSDKNPTFNVRQHWVQLRKRRGDVLNILDDLEGKRIQVQDKRRQKLEADRAIFRDIRLGLFKEDPNAMEKRLQTAERAQFAIDEIEQDLEALLDDLTYAERELEIMERRFYSQFVSDGITPPPDDRPSPKQSRPPSRASLFGISRDRPGLFHPLYMELREAFRNLQLAREDLYNLTSRRVDIESQDLQMDEERVRFLEVFPELDKPRLDEDSAKFMEAFPELEKKAEERLKHWITEFDRLQADCQEKGAIPLSTPFYEDSRGYQPIIRMEEDINLILDSPQNSPSANRSKTLSHPLYPILLSNPRHILHDPLPQTSKQALKSAVAIPKDNPNRGKFVSEAIQEHSISTLLFGGTLEDKNDYINRWLLHKLRTSAMEVENLRSVFDTVLKFIDTGRWQMDVLAFWSRDDAVKSQRSSADVTGRSNFGVKAPKSDKRDPEEIHSYPPTHANTEPVEKLHLAGAWDETLKPRLTSQIRERMNYNLRGSRVPDLDNRQSPHKTALEVPMLDEIDAAAAAITEKEPTGPSGNVGPRAVAEDDDSLPVQGLEKIDSGVEIPHSADCKIL